MKIAFIFKTIMLIICIIYASTLYSTESFAFDYFGAALNVGSSIADRADQQKKEQAAEEERIRQENRDKENKRQQEIAAEKFSKQQDLSNCMNNANFIFMQSGGLDLSGMKTAINLYIEEKNKLSDINLEQTNNQIDQLTNELNQKRSVITEYDNCLLDSQTTFFSKYGDFLGNKARYKTIKRKEKISCSSKKIDDFGDIIEPKCYYREFSETVETSEQKKYNSKYEKEHSKWLQDCSKDREFASPESIKVLQSQIDSLIYTAKQYNVIRSEVKKRVTYVDSYAVDYIKLIKDLWGLTSECTDWRKTNNISYSVAMDSMTTCQIFHNVIKWGNYKLYIDICPTADSELEY